MSHYIACKHQFDGTCCPCSLWPDASTVQPALLCSSVRGIAASLATSDSTVVWVPEADASTSSTGTWVPVSKACFLPKHEEPSSLVINAARRAGLAIPDMPAHIVEVCPSYVLLCVILGSVVQLTWQRTVCMSKENGACLSDFEQQMPSLPPWLVRTACHKNSHVIICMKFIIAPSM